MPVLKPSRISSRHPGPVPGTMLLLAIGLFAAQAWWLYGSTARDDAFLSYWPAHTLATTGEWLNYNGEHVEQSSTLLHTAWLAAMATLLPFWQIPFLAWLSSLLAAVLTLVCTAAVLHRQQATSLATLVLATVPGFLFWANSGMETALATLLLTGLLLLLASSSGTHAFSGQTMLPGVVNTKPSLVAPALLALLTVLAVLVRPEMFMVLLCFGGLYGGLLMLVGTQADHRLHTKPRLRYFLLVTVLAAIAVTAFRYHYFGQPFPQPVFAKSAGINTATLLKGIWYLLRAGDSLITQIVLAGGLLAFLASLLINNHPRRRAIICGGSLLVSQLAFVLATGGDWMEGARFLLPVIPAALMCLFAFLSPWQSASRILALLLLMIGLHDSVQFARTQSTGFAQWERQTWQQHYLAGKEPDARFSPAEHYTKDALRDMPQLQALLDLTKYLQGSAIARKPLEIMSIQMGFIPYHLALASPSTFHFLDLRGLSTRQLTDCASTRDFPHTDTGLKISYDDFFALLPVLQKNCGIQKPDVIYDMGWKMRKDVLLQNGYRFVYLEPRLVQGQFSRRGVGSDLFIAVRSELAEAAHLQTADNNEPLRRITQIAMNNKPNIVLLLGDDISYDTYGFMGNTAARTPTLDQLAHEGIVFTTVHTPSAFCRPTLASFLTGQWPHQSRIHANNGVIALPPGYRTLATLMQEQGYATFAGGKFWEDEPELRGFDSYDNNRNTFARQNQDALWQFMEQYAGKKPLFIWWAPMLPHTPHDPPQQYLDRIDPASIVLPPELSPEQQIEYRDRQHNFLAMTLWLDDEIRKVQDKLQEYHQQDNTLLVYLGDNGFSHRAVSKSSPYELGLRTPMIFHWPRHWPARRIDNQTSAIHLYATLLDVAGVTAAPALPSKSLLPILDNRQPPANETLYGASYQAVTLKTDPQPRPERDIFALTVRDTEWKYVLYVRDIREKDNADLTIKSGMQAFPTRNAGDEELFYLPEDGVEQHNLALDASHASRVMQYRKAVLQWWQNTGGQSFDNLRDCPVSPVALCSKVQEVLP